MDSVSAKSPRADLAKRLEHQNDLLAAFCLRRGMEVFNDVGVIENCDISSLYSL